MRTPETRSYGWDTAGKHHELNLVWVPGTDGDSYLFGREPRVKRIRVAGFFLGASEIVGKSSGGSVLAGTTTEAVDRVADEVVKVITENL